MRWVLALLAGLLQRGRQRHGEDGECYLAFRKRLMSFLLIYS